VDDRRAQRSRLRPDDVLRVGLGGLSTARLRSALAVLGIAVGIAAMVAVVGVSESSKADLLARLDRLGTDLLTIQPGNGFLSASQNELPVSSLAMIGLIPPVRAVAETINTTASVRRSDKIPAYLTGAITVFGADIHLPRALGIRLAHGTWPNAATDKYPTVVLGAGAAQTLGVDHLNPSIAVWLGQRWFTVIGILRPVALAPELDQAALVGIPAARRFLAADAHPTTIYVRTDPDQTLAVRDVLARTANPKNPQNVNVSRPSDALSAEIDAKGAYNALLLSLGAIALAVGAVGIVNVMVMAVIQRRTEIGLRRALGATRRHIAIQFTVEALLLSALGGAAGILAGILITAGYTHARHWSTTTSPALLAGALAAALTFGLIAGLYPSIRAASLSQPTPSEARREEHLTVVVSRSRCGRRS
jgi:putative ABC transport system permease protein